MASNFTSCFACTILKILLCSQPNVSSSQQAKSNLHVSKGDNTDWWRLVIIGTHLLLRTYFTNITFVRDWMIAPLDNSLDPLYKPSKQISVKSMWYYFSHSFHCSLFVLINLWMITCCVNFYSMSDTRPPQHSDCLFLSNANITTSNGGGSPAATVMIYDQLLHNEKCNLAVFDMPKYCQIWGHK